jgi:hypothetical protein
MIKARGLTMMYNGMKTKIPGLNAREYMPAPHLVQTDVVCRKCRRKLTIEHFAGGLEVTLKVCGWLPLLMGNLCPRCGAKSGLVMQQA